MTISNSMLNVASRAKASLGPFSRQVLRFVMGRMAPDGGFCGRSDASDLYYTVFGIDCLLALSGRVPTAKGRQFVMEYGDGADLDLVHLGCLARCWSRLPVSPSRATRNKLHHRLRSYRCPSGGYHTTRGARRGSVSGTFLALQAFEDLGVDERLAEALPDIVKTLRAQDGGYANEPRMRSGSTHATAGAALLLQRAGDEVPGRLVDWLLARVDTNGGFLASPQAPMPDLLSTATALYALDSLGVSLERIREPCMAFVERLQSESGGFCGHWMDDTPDCEYTYYALLALGSLIE